MEILFTCALPARRPVPVAAVWNLEGSVAKPRGRKCLLGSQWTAAAGEADGPVPAARAERCWQKQALLDASSGRLCPLHTRGRGPVDLVVACCNSVFACRGPLGRGLCRARGNFAWSVQHEAPAACTAQGAARAAQVSTAGVESLAVCRRRALEGLQFEALRQWGLADLRLGFLLLRGWFSLTC